MWRRESITETRYTKAHDYLTLTQKKHPGSIPNVHQNFYPGYHVYYSNHII
jgi:hypothetical protein